MKNLKYFFIALLLLQYSCVKDDTVTQFNPLNDIAIGDVDKNYEVETGANLVITPTVVTKSSDQSVLDYIWYKYNDAQATADTLSFEKNLNVQITDVLPGVETTVIFKVTDRTTGLFSQVTTKLKVIGLYSYGTLLLCETNGEYDLNFLRSKTNVMYENIYSNVNNGDKLSTKSNKIMLIDPTANSPILNKAIIVTANDPTGGVYLDPTVLVRKNTMREKFMYQDEFPGDINITGYASDQASDYLVVNNKMYERTLEQDANSWIGEVAMFPGVPNYSISGVVLSPFGSGYGYPFFGRPWVYDNANGYFLIKNNSYGSFRKFADKDLEGSTNFDIRNIGVGVELVMSGYRNSDHETMWSLMKDTKKDEYFLITYKMRFYDEWYGKITIEDKIILPKTDYPALYRAKQIISGSIKKMYRKLYETEAYYEGITDYFFYHVDNKVYSFNTGSKTEYPLIDLSGKNYTITSIGCDQIAEPTEEDEKANFVRLGIAIKDSSLPSKQAGIIFYRLSSLAGLSSTKYYEKMNICDEIKAFIEQNN